MVRRGGQVGFAVFYVFARGAACTGAAGRRRTSEKTGNKTALRALDFL